MKKFWTYRNNLHKNKGSLGFLYLIEFGFAPSFEVVSVTFALIRGNVFPTQVDEKRIAVVGFFLEALDNPQSVFPTHSDDSFFPV